MQYNISANVEMENQLKKYNKYNKLEREREREREREEGERKEA